MIFAIRQLHVHTLQPPLSTLCTVSAGAGFCDETMGNIVARTHKYRLATLPFPESNRGCDPIFQVPPALHLLAVKNLAFVGSCCVIVSNALAAIVVVLLHGSVQRGQPDERPKSRFGFDGEAGNVCAFARIKG